MLEKEIIKTTIKTIARLVVRTIQIQVNKLVFRRIRILIIQPHNRSSSNSSIIIILIMRYLNLNKLGIMSRTIIIIKRITHLNHLNAITIIRIVMIKLNMIQRDITRIKTHRTNTSSRHLTK